MYTFELPNDSGSMNMTLYKNIDFKFRKNIYQAEFVKGYIFVSTGDDGIDVYKMDG